eukprot:Rmarinus@m.27704
MAETEWESIQRKMGNLPPKEVAVSKDELGDMIEEAAQNYDPLAHKTLAELDEVEDEFGDDEFFEEYRSQRISELREQAVRSRFGGLQHIRATEYKAEVDTGDTFCVVLLHQGTEDCKILEHALHPLAVKFPVVKFVAIKATDAIPNYPDALCPTILVYQHNDIVKQFLGLSEFGGKRATPDDLEWKLSELGVVETDLEEPPSISKPNRIKVNIMR